MCDTLSKNRIDSTRLIIPTEPDNGTKELELKIESDRLKPFNDAKCTYCGIQINVPTLGDDHSKCSPDCFSMGTKAIPPGQDVCGNVTFTDSVKFSTQMNDVKSRIKSFENWPQSSKQEPQLLAEAGFYYKGTGDKTVCFCCSGPLHNWEENDDPWEQHAIWFPKCKFLLKEKGVEYVREVKTKLKIVGRNAPCDEENMCIICCNSQREVVLVPCGHDWTCLRCVESLEDKKCPICREQIVQIEKI